MAGDQECRNPTDVKPSQNSRTCVVIPNEGTMEFRFTGRDGQPLEPPIVVDVMGTNDEWWVQSIQYREGPTGPVKDECTVEFNNVRRAFVQGLANQTYAKLPLEDKPVVTHFEAAFFIDRLAEEVRRLQDFFSPATPATSSSPGSTDVRFSQ